MPPKTGVSNSHGFKPRFEFRFLKALRTLAQGAFIEGELINYIAEDAIIGSNEQSRSRFQNYPPTLTPHAGINNSHMNSSLREIAISAIDNESSLENVLRLDRMSYINNVNFGVNAQDDAFHNSNIGIVGAKIGG